LNCEVLCWGGASIYKDEIKKSSLGLLVRGLKFWTKGGKLFGYIIHSAAAGDL
jgi:hypothetical protein